MNNRHEPLLPLTSTSASERKRDFYEHFLENTGRDQFNSQAVNITMTDFYERGYYILAWDRTSSCNNRFTRHTMDPGVLSINLKHGGAGLTSNMQIIMYSSYSDVLKIDGTSVSSRIK